MNYFITSNRKYHCESQFAIEKPNVSCRRNLLQYKSSMWVVEGIFCNRKCQCHSQKIFLGPQKRSFGIQRCDISIFIYENTSVTFVFNPKRSHWYFLCLKLYFLQVSKDLCGFTLKCVIEKYQCESQNAYSFSFIYKNIKNDFFNVLGWDW